MSLKEEFGLRVRQHRLAKRLSQLELGVMVDVSERTIRNIETGKHGPQFDLLEALAQALETPARNLFPE